MTSHRPYGYSDLARALRLCHAVTVTRMLTQRLDGCGQTPTSTNQSEHRDITRRVRWFLTFTGNDPVFTFVAPFILQVRLYASFALAHRGSRCSLACSLGASRSRHCGGHPGFHRCIRNSPSSDCVLCEHWKYL